MPMALVYGVYRLSAAMHHVHTTTTSMMAYADQSTRAPTSLMFVSAFIDLGPTSTDKTVTERVHHFRVLASSGIPMIIFVSPSYQSLLTEVCRDYPNVERIEPTTMDMLKSVQIIRAFPNIQLPVALTSYKDTRGFLELMLAKVDFVHEAAQYTNATHLAWIDFNIAHVFKSAEPLDNLRKMGGHKLKPHVLSVAGIWDRGVNVEMASLLSQVNWRFAGGFFLGDRASLERWYDLSCDALRLFLSQTNVLIWEVNFWAWLEQTFPQSFRPQVYKSDHDDSLVLVPRAHYGEGEEIRR